MTRSESSRAAPLASWAAAAVWLVLLAGLFFHHSETPRLFGRFSIAYAVCLVAWALATPLVYLAARALLSTTVQTRKDGSELRVPPAQKLALVAGSMVAVYALLQVAAPSPRLRFESNAFLQTVPSPYAAAGVNRRGFRGEDPALPKPAGHSRVLLLGGSTTFDPSLEYADSYGKRLQDLLSSRLAPRTVDVQCAAMPAFTTAHDLVRYALDAIDLDADVVLVMEAINDLYANVEFHERFRTDYGHVTALARDRLLPWFHDRTPLLRTLRHFWNSVLFSDSRGVPVLETRGIVPDAATFARNLRSIVVLGRSRAQRVVLCTQPHRYRLDLPPADRIRGEAALRDFRNGQPLPNFLWFVENMAAFNQKIREVAASEGAPLLDFERLLPTTGTLYGDEIHMTKEGALLEAALAARFLEDQGLLR
jgi:hypothetical protein